MTTSHQWLVVLALATIVASRIHAQPSPCPAAQPSANQAGSGNCSSFTETDTQQQGNDCPVCEIKQDWVAQTCSGFTITCSCGGDSSTCPTVTPYYLRGICICEAQDPAKKKEIVNGYGYIVRAPAMQCTPQWVDSTVSPPITHPAECVPSGGTWEWPTWVQPRCREQDC